MHTHHEIFFSANVAIVQIKLIRASKRIRLQKLFTYESENGVIELDRVDWFLET